MTKLHEAVIIKGAPLRKPCLGNNSIFLSPNKYDNHGLKTRKHFFFWSRIGAGKLCPTGQIQLTPLLKNKVLLAHRCTHVHPYCLQLLP